MAKKTTRIPTSVMRSTYPILGSGARKAAYPDVVDRIDMQIRGDMKYRNKSMKRF